MSNVTQRNLTRITQPWTRLLLGKADLTPGLAEFYLHMTQYLQCLNLNYLLYVTDDVKLQQSVVGQTIPVQSRLGRQGRRISGELLLHRDPLKTVSA